VVVEKRFRGRLVSAVVCRPFVEDVIPFVNQAFTSSNALRRSSPYSLYCLVTPRFSPRVHLDLQMEFKLDLLGLGVMGRNKKMRFLRNLPFHVLGPFHVFVIVKGVLTPREAKVALNESVYRDLPPAGVYLLIYSGGGFDKYGFFHFSRTGFCHLGDCHI
jgi:hypothetical protein